MGSAVAAGTAALPPKSFERLVLPCTSQLLPLFLIAIPPLQHAAHSTLLIRNVRYLITETMQESREKKPQTPKLAAAELRGTEPGGWEKKARSGKGWEPLKLALQRDKMLM